MPKSLLEPTPKEPAQVAVWLLHEAIGDVEVSRMEELIRAAILVLGGE